MCDNIPPSAQPPNTPPITPSPPAKIMTDPPSLPSADLDPALAKLHAHYRALLDAERHAFQLERDLWESERALLERRVAALEARLPDSAGKEAAEEATNPPPASDVRPPPANPLGPPSETTEPEEAEHERYGERHEPPQHSPEDIAVVDSDDSHEHGEGEEDDEEEEISGEQLRQLLQEAKRVVYPSYARNRPRGRSLADTPQGELPPILQGRRTQRRRDEGETVELKLKKTSNFGMEFGKAWGGFG